MTLTANIGSSLHNPNFRITLDQSQSLHFPRPIPHIFLAQNLENPIYIIPFRCRRQREVVKE